MEAVELWYIGQCNPSCILSWILFEIVWLGCLAGFLLMWPTWTIQIRSPAMTVAHSFAVQTGVIAILLLEIRLREPYCFLPFFMLHWATAAIAVCILARAGGTILRYADNQNSIGFIDETSSIAHAARLIIIQKRAWLERKALWKLFAVMLVGVTILLCVPTLVLAPSDSMCDQGSGPYYFPRVLLAVNAFAICPFFVAVLRSIRDGKRMATEYIAEQVALALFMALYGVTIQIRPNLPDTFPSIVPVTLYGILASIILSGYPAYRAWTVRWRNLRMLKHDKGMSLQNLVTGHQLGEGLWKDFRDFAGRDLCGENVLFCEAYEDLLKQVFKATGRTEVKKRGLAESLRSYSPQSTRDGVLHM
ncbi:hypothetical protein M427DRAFT_64302 [Gonapodya prolifera JEL478]|uniref:Uncharacterized protein n=1 Tax=Gonapodya prolifera (strain JEL478) TaxID=1344416 RepID=A0A138ZXU3_GONPJ|nr:hypothetical protein M427DRAFT_64302 [Gonapodya prolifera JEL478]|eukprot:KXS09332.1 hypothetical protein M427DRAFT_64302 [Gonapodya prolifera JEL478]